MRTNTQAVALEASHGEVFRFIADPQNLPRWAVGFARGVRQTAEGWIVETASGEVRVRVAADAASGVIDFSMRQEGGGEMTAYSRVIPAGEGSIYVFTQMQPDGMPDSVFDGQVMALAEELKILGAMFRAQSACRT